MYRLAYLPIAKRDIEDTVTYITHHLKSPGAAMSLLDSLESAIMKLRDFPYSHSVYRTIRPLQKEFRMVPVGNYAVFYVVREPDKIIEVSRVIYAKRNILNILSAP